MLADNIVELFLYALLLFRMCGSGHDNNGDCAALCVTTGSEDTSTKICNFIFRSARFPHLFVRNCLVYSQLLRESFFQSVSEYLQFLFMPSDREVQIARERNAEMLGFQRAMTRAVRFDLRASQSSCALITSGSL